MLLNHPSIESRLAQPREIAEGVFSARQNHAGKRLIDRANNPARMELSVHWEKGDAFTAEQYGQGRTWRQVESDAPAKVSESVGVSQ